MEKNRWCSRYIDCIVGFCNTKHKVVKQVALADKKINKNIKRIIPVLQFSSRTGIIDLIYSYLGAERLSSLTACLISSSKINIRL